MCGARHGFQPGTFALAALRRAGRERRATAGRRFPAAGEREAQNDVRTVREQNSRRSPRRCRIPRVAGLLLPLLMLTIGCTQKMSEQPRLEVYEASTFFDDGRGSRRPVPGTVARGRRPHEIQTTSRVFRTGLSDGEPVDRLPDEVIGGRRLEEILQRGREQYEVFCVPCHGLLGDGRGFVVRRGFPAPPSYHIPRLREVPLGSIFRVITDGHGKMAAYAGQVPPEDRWMIAAYVRVLQFSRYAPLDQLAPGDRRQLPGDNENSGEDNDATNENESP